MSAGASPSRVLDRWRGPSRAARWRRRRLRRIAATMCVAMAVWMAGQHGSGAAPQTGSPGSADQAATSPSGLRPSASSIRPHAPVPPGRAELVVPLAERHTADLVQPGDVVDLYDGESTSPIASRVTVVSSLTNSDPSASAESPAVLIAASDAQIGEITRSIARSASAGSALRIALVGPSPKL